MFVESISKFKLPLISEELDELQTRLSSPCNVKGDSQEEENQK